MKLNNFLFKYGKNPLYTTHFQWWWKYYVLCVSLVFGGGWDPTIKFAGCR